MNRKRLKTRSALLAVFAATSLALTCVTSATAESSTSVDRENSSQTPDYSPVVTCETDDGRIVCGGGSFSQIPGKTDLFIGKGQGIAATMDECHHPKKLPDGSTVWRDFLAVYKMDWKNHKMIFQNFLLKLADRPAPGVTILDNMHIAAAADPYVVSHEGKLWVAFEVSVGLHGIVGNGSCVAPISSDLKQIDISKISLVAAPSNQKSASTPVLLSFHDHLYVYWTNCNGPELDRKPESKLLVHGMEIEEDGNGRMWGKNSGRKPVDTDDPQLTTVVYDAKRSDVTRDHVANLWCVREFGDKIVVLASVGGTVGAPPCCCSPHELNPGCWRLSISVADSPLGKNVFGDRILDLPSLPSNAMSYARIAIDPTNHHILLASFHPPNRIGSDPNAKEFPAGFLKLKSGKSVDASGGMLVMKANGELLYQTAHDKPLWSSPRHDDKDGENFYASFQGDGNLAIYKGEQPYWATGTAGHPGATLIVSNSLPYLSIVEKKSNQLLWPYHIHPWPSFSSPPRVVPPGERYISFDSILKEALK